MIDICFSLFCSSADMTGCCCYIILASPTFWKMALIRWEHIKSGASASAVLTCMWLTSPAPSGFAFAESTFCFEVRNDVD